MSARQINGFFTPVLRNTALSSEELTNYLPWLFGLALAFALSSIVAHITFFLTGLLAVQPLAPALVIVLFLGLLAAIRKRQWSPPNVALAYLILVSASMLATLLFVGMVREPVGTLIAFTNLIFLTFALFCVNPGMSIVLFFLNLAGLELVRLSQMWMALDVDLAHYPISNINAIGVGSIFAVHFVFTLFLARTIWRQRLTNANSRQKLEELNAQLRSAEQDRAELFRAVTHEIKTPLTSIAGYLDLMLTGEPAFTNMENLQVVRRSAYRLQRLTEEMTLQEDPQSLLGNLRLESIDLAELLRDEIAAFFPQSKRRNVEVVLDTEPGPVHVLGDKIRVGQVIGILLDNAIRHSLPAQRVFIRVKTLPAAILIEVHNSSAPISPEVIGRLFEPFYLRSVGATHGMGIGLSMAKRLISAMGGDVSASGRESGIVLSVQLPRTAAISRPKGRRALVLDDEPEVLDITEQMLRRMGYEVFTVQNGTAALDIALREPFDIVLLDINVPGLTGIEVARQLRLAKSSSRILVMSGLIRSDATRILLESKADGFISKPFELDAVEKLLGGVVT